MSLLGELRGEVPVVKVHRRDLIGKEKDKYDEVWNSIPDYGDKSPGLEGLELFLTALKVPPRSSIIDIGCGTGKAGLELRKKGHQVWYLDLTDAGLDPAIDRRRFIQQPIWKFLGSGRYFEYGYCADVMEHIPTEFTMLAAHNLLRCCGTIWFSISLIPDEFGHAIGKPLHICVQEFDWWRDRLALVGNLTDARDMGAKGIYVVSR